MKCDLRRQLYGLFKYAASLYLVKCLQNKCGYASRVPVGQASWQFHFLSPLPSKCIISNLNITSYYITFSRSYKCLIDDTRCTAHDDTLKPIFAIGHQIDSGVLTKHSLKSILKIFLLHIKEHFLSALWNDSMKLILAVCASIREVTQVLPTGTSLGTSSSK